jgi:hypothetical protein
MTDTLAQRLPVDLRITARGGVAVPHVVQFDRRKTGRRRQLLNRRVIVSGCGGLPSSQQNSTP